MGLPGKNYDDDGKIVKIDNKTETDRQAAFEQISKKAILVNLHRKQISNMPFDVKLTNEVCLDLKINNNEMLQIRKFMFNPQHLSKIRSLINDALLILWNYTVPWENIGYRLLPMKYYEDFNETFGKIKDEFEEAVKEFIDNYDDYKKESKQILGKVFNKNDYPDKDLLPNMFQLEIETTKFPDINDIRLNMTGDELMEMKKEAEEKYTNTVETAVNNILSLIGKDVHESYNNKLIGIAESLNSSPEINVKLAELKEQYGSPEDSGESMMVMDDPELSDLEEICNDDNENMDDLL